MLFASIQYAICDNYFNKEQLRVKYENIVSTGKTIYPFANDEFSNSVEPLVCVHSMESHHSWEQLVCAKQLFVVAQSMRSLLEFHFIWNSQLERVLLVSGFFVCCVFCVFGVSFIYISLVFGCVVLFEAALRAECEMH